ncbi:MAG: PUA domain-containing protein [Thermoplasmatota archaeon]
MKELSVKRRSKLRSKDAKRILVWMDEEWGIDISRDLDIETCSLEGKTAYITAGKIIGVEEKGGLLLTLKGIMELSPSKKWITVDMGAVKYLANGADVMAPGVVDADSSIEPEDLVWVRDERNLRPLCVGRALMGGEEMRTARSGKAVATLHYVGDPIFNAQL